MGSDEETDNRERKITNEEKEKMKDKQFMQIAHVILQKARKSVEKPNPPKPQKESKTITVAGEVYPVERYRRNHYSCPRCRWAHSWETISLNLALERLFAGRFTHIRISGKKRTATVEFYGSNPMSFVSGAVIDG
jgi:hypothetical protein